MPTIQQYFDIPSSYGGLPLADDSLLYLCDASGTTQIWRQRGSLPPEQVTDFADRVMRLYASPDGEGCFFTKDTGGDERAQIWRLDTQDKAIQLTDDPKVTHQFGGVSPDGHTLYYACNRRHAAHFDLCSMDLQTGEHRILLQNEDFFNTPATLSPDGRWLCFNKMRGKSDNHLWMLDTGTGELRQVGRPGAEATYEEPVFQADSSALYLLTDQDMDVRRVMRYDPEAGTLSRVHEELWDIEDLAFSAEDRFLAMVVREEGFSRLKVLDKKRYAFVQLPEVADGLISGLRWHPEKPLLYFTWSGGARPRHVWSLDVESGQLSQVTKGDTAGIDPESLIAPTLHRFTSFDGLSVPYYFYQAPGDAPGPVLLSIHGGPEGQERPAFKPVYQYLLSQGISIAAPNVRGSDGYGKEYVHLDDKEKRLDSVKDIGALVEHLVEVGQAKAGHMAVMGASYGGFMTLSCLARLPQHFAAGVDIVGITNLVTFLTNTSSYRRAHRESEYGSLEHQRDMLFEVSPIAKVQDIRAPLMVVHGANDPRVPISEAEQIVQSLQKRGIPVQYLRYEDEGHGLAKKKNQLDCYQQVASFLRENLGVKA